MSAFHADGELHIRRGPGVVLHAALENGEACFSLQMLPAPPGATIEQYGLMIASAAPRECTVDTTKSPPALWVDGAMFVLSREQADIVRAWLLRATGGLQ